MFPGVSIEVTLHNSLIKKKKVKNLACEVKFDLEPLGGKLQQLPKAKGIQLCDPAGDTLGATLMRMPCPAFCVHDSQWVTTLCPSFDPLVSFVLRRVLSK